MDSIFEKMILEKFSVTCAQNAVEDFHNQLQLLSTDKKNAA